MAGRGEPDGSPHADPDSANDAGATYTPLDTDTPVDLGQDDEVDGPKTITVNLENLPPGTKVQFTLETPGDEPLYDPSKTRSKPEPIAQESSDPEYGDLEKDFKSQPPSWKDFPLTLATGSLTVPADVMAAALPGTLGLIAGVVAPLINIPAIWFDMRKWRRGGKKRNED